MDSTVLAAIVSTVGVVAGALIQSQLPPQYFPRLFGRAPANNNIIGIWDSSWGPSDAEINKYQEVLIINKQYKDKVFGYATQAGSDRAWDYTGTFDGTRLEMFYRPSYRGDDIDFQDYGCYFLVRQGNGSLRGFSAGLGPNPETGKDELNSDHHLMVRRSRLVP